MFPAAALVALCYRFPIPFSRYEGGPAAVARSAFAVVFFLFVGVGPYGGPLFGFAELAALGAVAGAAAHLLGGRNTARRRWLTLALVLAVDLAVAVIMAIGWEK
jgi:hypothetical protein